MGSLRYVNWAKRRAKVCTLMLFVFGTQPDAVNLLGMSANTLVANRLLEPVKAVSK